MASPRKQADDTAMNKLKVLDVKIVQQIYKVIDRQQILQHTRVFDGTGKKQIDENSDEIAALLAQDP